MIHKLAGAQAFSLLPRWCVKRLQCQPFFPPGLQLGRSLSSHTATLQLWVVQPHPGWNPNPLYHMGVTAERIINGLQSANKNHANTAFCRILSLNCSFGSLLQPGQVSTEWPSLTWTSLGGTVSKHRWMSWVGKRHRGVLSRGGLMLGWLQ